MRGRRGTRAARRDPGLHPAGGRKLEVTRRKEIQKTNKNPPPRCCSQGAGTLARAGTVTRPCAPRRVTQGALVRVTLPLSRHPGPPGAPIGGRWQLTDETPEPGGTGMSRLRGSTGAPHRGKDAFLPKKGATPQPAAGAQGLRVTSSPSGSQGKRNICVLFPDFSQHSTRSKLTEKEM